MSTGKKILTGAIILALAGAAAAYGWFLYQKEPPDIRTQKAGLEITAIDLVKAFQQDETTANAKYVDKVLVVAGTVTNVQTDSSGATVTLQTNDPLAAVTCSFYQDEEGVKKIKAGSPARIKGNCTGILSDVVLNKCSLVE